MLDWLSKLPWWLLLPGAAVSYYFMGQWAREILADATPASPWLAFNETIRIIFFGAQHLVAAAFLAAAGLSFFARRHRVELAANTQTLRDLNGISWQNFELLVGESYRQRGFKVREVGGGGPDGGVDLVAVRDHETLYIQCKHWKSLQVGVDVVRQIFGVMAAEGGTGCVVVSSGRYTDAARDFAKGRNVDLIDGKRLLRLLADARRDMGSNAPAIDATGTSAPALVRSDESPQCPKCAAPMRRVKVKKGQHAGQWFFGCVRFPDCRGVIRD